MRTVYTVSQVNGYIRRMFTEDYLLPSLLVRGEVSNCKYHASGHIYFTLKDATGTLSCVMFAGRRRGLSFRMKEGDQVIVHGHVDVYERDGKYQLYADQILADGAGVLNERYERLKKRLHEEGYFDEAHKKPIPKFIRTLGVITASTGAAVRDIIHITMRRNPGVQIILYPAIVQGEAAAESIVRGITMLDRIGVDVIIIGRGGGPLEDLWAFNEEAVAMAVYDCDTPVISAVGHETDTVITDYVADLRAPTPSAAAELAVFELDRLQQDLAMAQDSLRQRMERELNAARDRLRLDRQHLQHLSPQMQLTLRRDRLETFRERLTERMLERIRAGRMRLRACGALRGQMERSLHSSRSRLEKDAGILAGLSPAARLAGGYGFVTQADGTPVRSVAAVCPGDMIGITLRDGRVTAEVRETRKTENAGRTYE